jgi:hypothetical protein
MFGLLEKRSGNLHVYQTRFFAREKHLLHYYAKIGDKKPRGSIDLTLLSDIVLIVDLPSDILQAQSQAAFTTRFSTFARPTRVNNQLESSSFTEFMLQVGHRNFILRAPDRVTRDAWIEDLCVWIKASGIEDCAIPIPKTVLRGLIRGMQYCIEHGTFIEGLFRVPGSKSAVEQIFIGIYMYGDKYFDMNPTVDPLDVGSAIKKLLRELPENIFTAKLLPLLKAASTPESVIKILRSLPLENMHLLAKLAELFDQLCIATEITKMNARNLAISIGPSICETEATPLILFETMIKRRSDIFGDLSPLSEMVTNFAKFNISKTTTKRVSQTKKYRDETEAKNSNDLAVLDDPDIVSYVSLMQGLERRDSGYIRTVDQILKSANDAADYLQKNFKAKWDEELDEDLDDDMKKERLKNKMLAARIAELEILLAPPPPPPTD